MLVELVLGSGRTLRAEMPSPFAYKKIMDEQRKKLGIAAGWAFQYGSAKEIQEHIKDAPPDIVERLVEFEADLDAKKLELVHEGIKQLDPKSNGLDDLNPDEFAEFLKKMEQHFFGMYTTESKPSGAKTAQK